MPLSGDILTRENPKQLLLLTFTMVVC
ncbi:MAG: hypothetical protein J07HX64_02853 [halophilic archaeon J07HX64]|nr:MAG: hypothetical protein J07HX64_02853 [halophilic archaeon J07HX64]